MNSTMVVVVIIAVSALVISLMTLVRVGDLAEDLEKLKQQ